MDSFLLADSRKNVNIWDIPVLYGDSADIFIETEKRDGEEDLPGGVSRLHIQKRSIDLQKEKRDTLPVVYVRGSFYEIGFKIGRTFSSLIRDHIEKNPDVALGLKLYETAKGKAVYNSCYDAVSRFYPEYMRELGGIADGSGMPFHKVFLLHMEDIMLVALPAGEKRPVPSRGSTTIIATNLHNQAQLLGQVVDANVAALTNMYIVKATITESCPVEEFTALCIGGMLSGNTMAFNVHGVVIAVDPVPVRKCNECGVPRSILCRALLSAHDCSKVGSILKCDGSGIGNGLSVIFTQIGIQADAKNFWSYEAGPRYPAHSSSCVSRIEISPHQVTYFHMNKFQHLTAVQEIIDDSYSKWILTKSKTLTNNKKDFTLEMNAILGDNSINTFELKNIYTSVVSTCGIVSAAVGIFDIMEETWSIYLDNPGETEPTISYMPMFTKAS